MKQVCLSCKRTALDHNLYCQEIYCPAEMSPTILDYGEWLGNIEIVKPLVVLRSSVLYEARHQKKRVLLKVAHPGAENRERLKREALFLKECQRSRDTSEFLPVVLPAYAKATADTDDDAYGKVVLKNHLLYYCIFEDFTGDPLRDILTKNLQMWVYHIGWISINLASAVAFLQAKKKYHFAISPESLLVRLDDESNAPKILLFDLGIISDEQDIATNWYPFAALPAYTAPELLGRTIRASYSTDVYGIGLVLYELLVGQPVYAHKLLSDQDVYSAVLQSHRVSMTRSQDVRAAADIAIKAVDQNVGNRFAHAAEMVGRLRESFGEQPVKKRLLTLPVIVSIAVVLLAVVFIVVATQFIG